MWNSDTLEWIDIELTSFCNISCKGCFRVISKEADKILNKTYNLAAVCKKNGVRINTFMIASDPYLMEFVEKFTEINDGSAYFADLQNLGSMIFKDYNRNKVKRY